MTVIVSSQNPTVGRIVDLRLRYEGQVDEDHPPPNDLHIDWRNPETGEWEGVTGWSEIPAGTDPTIEFDFELPPSMWSVTGSQGEHEFRVVWTHHEGAATAQRGRTIATEDLTVDTTPRPHDPPLKEWNWYVFWGKVLAGAFASTVAGVILNWWTAVAVIPCAITGFGGGAGGSAIGHIFAHLFDAPRKWTFRSSFLFTFFFTLAFAMLFGIQSIELEVAAIELGDVYNRVTFGVSLVSALLAAMLPGLLDNLRNDAE